MADLRSELEKVKDQVETVDAPKKLETLEDVIAAVADISEVVNGLSDTVVEIAENHNEVVEDLRNVSMGVSKPSIDDKERVEMELKKAQTRKTCAETKKLEKEIEESPEAVRMFKRVLGVGVFVVVTLFGLGALSDAMKD